MVKYFSDVTKKYYETADAAAKAEHEAEMQIAQEKALAERKAAELKEKKEKEAAERKQMAGEIENARQTMIQAQKAYRDAIEAFVNKYGSYHWSSKNADDIPTLFSSFFDKFWF